MRISLVNMADMFTCTKEIPNVKIQFLCSGDWPNSYHIQSVSRLHFLYCQPDKRKCRLTKLPCFSQKRYHRKVLKNQYLIQSSVLPDPEYLFRYYLKRFSAVIFLLQSLNMGRGTYPLNERISSEIRTNQMHFFIF